MNSKSKWAIGISVLVIVFAVAILLVFMLGKSGAVIDSGSNEATPAVSDATDSIDTEAPTTEPSATQAPTAEDSTTEPPTTEASATEPSTMEPSADEPDLDVENEDDGGANGGEINFDDLLDAMG